MRSFVLKCIEIFETDRQEYERGKPREKKPSVKDKIEEAKHKVIEGVENLEKSLDILPEEPSRLSLAQALSEFKKAQVERLDTLEDVYETEQQETINKQQLMQNLATIGIAASAMGHEILDTSRKVMKAVNRLAERLNALMLLADEKAKEYMGRLHRYGRILYSVSNFALGHIDRDRRRWQKIDVDSVIQDLYEETLQEMCATNEAEIDLTLGGVPYIFYAFPYEVESIVINFVTNSIAAFRRGRIPVADRRIEIETRYDESVRQISIIARDSGPGIPEGDEERIFDIYSTKVDNEGKPIGTGLGLAIVKDIVDSHNGTIEVRGKGNELPGAEFIVTLPVPRRRGRRKGEGNGK
jgi:signal transduction histidine kinase